MRLVKRSSIVILIAAALAASAPAQTRKPDVKRDARTSGEKAAPSVSLVERAGADYLSGEANVAVRGNQNPVIKLGLSPNGATIIEFPASDKLFNIIPGNSNLVTIEESPTKETDRFVIVRPGDGFASPTTMAQARRQPATSVIVQMTSGLVITFLFYPVPQLAEQAHRVVVTYDRSEVIAARRAAGLAVNLDSGADETRPKNTSLRVASPQGAAAHVASRAARTAEEDGPETPGSESAGGGNSSAERTPGEEARASRSLEESRHDEPLPPLSKQKRVEYVNAASEALAAALKHPEAFKHWGKETHGLSISAAPVREMDGRAQVAVFAVRNSRKTAARLVPGQPEINIETVNDKGRLLNVQTVTKLGQHTDAFGEVIPGKAVQYYAVAYEAPILGFRQRLRVSVGTTTAADEPAIVGLIR